MKCWAKSFVIILVTVFLTSLLIYQPINVEAVSPKTIVVPDQFHTIQAAIDNATNGNTILIKSGIYDEKTLEINKSITIIGENAKDTIITLHPSYNVTWITTTPFFNFSNAITIVANNFALINLTLIIAEPGGYISANGQQIQITGNNITTSHTTTGLIVSGSFCNITKNTSNGNINVEGSSNIIAGNVVRRIMLNFGELNKIQNNTSRDLIFGNSYKNCSHNIIQDNKISTVEKSYGSGIIAYNLYHNTFIGNYISGNRFGLAFEGNGAGNTFYQNTFNDNEQQVRINIGAVVGTNYWDNGQVGNYWSDYDGNGAYVIDENNIDHYPLIQQVDISSEAPTPLGALFTPLTIGIITISIIAVLTSIALFRRHRKTADLKSSKSS
jgi:parallel beta-helix repeat protein